MSALRRQNSIDLIRPNYIRDAADNINGKSVSETVYVIFGLTTSKILDSSQIDRRPIVMISEHTKLKRSRTIDNVETANQLRTARVIDFCFRFGAAGAMGT